MFGVLHCNKEAPDRTDFIELSEGGNLETRSQAIMACDQCQQRKLKCNGESYQCRRCQVTSSICTYRRVPYSKRRLEAPDVREGPLQPLAKRVSLNSNATYGNTPPISSGLGVDLNQPMPFENPGESFWTPVSLLGSEISGGSRQWNGLHDPNLDNQDYGDMSLMNFPLPELEDVASHEEASVGQTVPAASSFVASQGQSPGCNCISVLANSLERINGDTDNDVDESEQFDHLLMYLYDGIETCKKVKLCKRCSVYTTNSMVVVTLIQQLAVAAQTLSLQLVKCQQRVSKISSVVEISQTLRADIHVGEYKVQTTSLHLKFLFPIAGMYLKDLQQLIKHLQDDMKKGTKTFKMLSAVADTVRKAGRSIQI